MNFIAPEIGTIVWGRDYEHNKINGYVSGFMGNPTNKDGRYSIQITFFDSIQKMAYYTPREKGKMWNTI